MQWLHLLSSEPSLPDHCEPTHDFLLWFSSVFHVCVPTPLAFTSNLLGGLSIVAWLFAQLPQIYKNWSLSSTSGLSIFFLVEWCLGDLSNLLGALFTHQAPWQVAIGCYYVFVDLCLVFQWVWYERLKKGKTIRIAWFETSTEHPNHGPMAQVDSQNSRPKIVFRSPTFDSTTQETSTSQTRSTTIHRAIPASSSPSSFPHPSPKTILLLACILHLATTHATPIIPPSPSLSSPITTLTTTPTLLSTLGTFLSWLSTLLYLISRLPQLYKNYTRKSTAGLSPALFLAAFCGNLFYSSALLTNPCAWHSFGPYGGGGWVGEEGSDRRQWVLAALPFFLGAAGVLGMDAGMGVQIWVYGDRQTVRVRRVKKGKGKKKEAEEEEVEAEAEEVIGPVPVVVEDRPTTDGAATEAKGIPIARPSRFQARNLDVGGSDAEEGGASPIEILRPSSWRKVSGWMRGWIPSLGEGNAFLSGSSSDEEGGEREGLLVARRQSGDVLEDDGEERRYGGV